MAICSYGGAIDRATLAGRGIRTRLHGLQGFLKPTRGCMLASAIPRALTRHDVRLNAGDIAMKLAHPVAFAMVALTSSLAAQGNPPTAQRPTPMVLTIPAWPDGQQIPVKFTQAGEQVSPELKWSNVPAGTQSFVVNMLDPDVAVQRGTEAQPHWIVWNIPATVTGLPEGMKPGAEQADGTRQISAS